MIRSLGNPPGTVQSQPQANQQQQQQQKEFNIVSLCRFGQETVQDISSRFQEVFAALKSVQPPNINNHVTERYREKGYRTVPNHSFAI
ncbi:hypothetical protein HA402_007441 [Bradysia odoriphaga]|nr:hypothetical protein HA402_007441 [Bradysia odoriphaga]